MGYSMRSVGAVVLPAEVETDAHEAAATAMARLQGWFPDDGDPDVTTLADLARFVGADLSRDGDRLRVGTDDGGDPKWSDQATGFYLALAPYVSSGEVRFVGEDGQEWSYLYRDGAVRQRGINGWDGSSEPFGPPADLTDPPPEPPAEPHLRPSVGRDEPRRPLRPRATRSADEEPSTWLGLSPTAVGLLIGATVLLVLVLSL